MRGWRLRIATRSGGWLGKRSGRCALRNTKSSYKSMDRTPVPRRPSQLPGRQRTVVHRKVPLLPPLLRCQRHCWRLAGIHSHPLLLRQFANLLKGLKVVQAGRSLPARIPGVCGGLAHRVKATNLMIPQASTQPHANFATRADALSPAREHQQCQVSMGVVRLSSCMVSDTPV